MGLLTSTGHVLRIARASFVLAREGAFIGQHGSWNREPRSGNDVVFVPFKDGAPLSLTITVRELGYNAAAATVTRKVSVRCVLSARVVNGAGNWEGTFPVGQEKEMVTVPGEADNARFLNDVLSESLSMLLSDPELVQYLGHDPFQAKIVK